MIIGGNKVGVIRWITRIELDKIISGLPKTIKYSYKCVYNGIGNSKYHLYLFRNIEES